ncbi:MAG: aldehyde dehydrogenase [Oscillospiraceae bacterium]
MDIRHIIMLQKEFFATNKTKDVQFRLKKLHRLKSCIIQHEPEILAALKEDLNKAEFESYACEIGILLDEINYLEKHLTQWCMPQKVKTPLTQFPSVSKIYSEPYGVVLIISPWNYPFMLSMQPLITAIASGNCVVLKPSDYAPCTAKVVKKIIEQVFAPNFAYVVLGGRETNTALLAQKFDYIFFTGSPTVGKLVMQSAAKNLTPLSLELGGKSPCIVDNTANIKLAAKRIAWGKFLNAGQTCVAPDYLYVHKDVKSELINELKKSISKLYGDVPLYNDELPKIINQKHFMRLVNLMKNEKVILGGQSDKVSEKIEPTLLADVSWRSPVMQQEIFGPILPILEFSELSDVIEIIKSKPKPLALYLFTQSAENKNRVLNEISFGGGCINDTVIHLATPYMPFGGVGNSGMGNYHGKFGFDTFSHKKSILKKSNLFDIPLRYAPYKNKLTVLKKIMK